MWLELFLACAGTPPLLPVPPPADLVGTWRVGDTVERWSFTTDGRFQHTSKDGFTNTGIVTAWQDAKFTITSFPAEESHAVVRMPYVERGYTWLVIDETTLWRQSTEAKIGAPLPPEKSEGAQP